VWLLQPDNPAKVEPPQLIKDQFDLMEKVKQAPTYEQRIDLMKQVLQVAADQFWVIGVSSPPTTYHPVNAKIANVPDGWVDGWPEGGVAIAFPEVWYFTE
jgi:peptide/nickel transport system substrate-binding protein